MPNLRRLPVRIFWGPLYDRVLDAYPLERPRSFSLPRAGSRFAQVSSGIEDGWIRGGHDQLLVGAIRHIPHETGLSPEARRLSGWDGADGWAKALDWARRKNPLRLQLEGRNLALQTALSLDANVDGVPDGWGSTRGAGNVVTWSVDGAQAAARATLAAGGNTSGAIAYAGLNQIVRGIAPGAGVNLSGEIMVSGLTNGVNSYLQLDFRDAAGNNLAYGTAGGTQPTGVFARHGGRLVAPAGTSWARINLGVAVPANTGTLSTGSLWFRNIRLDFSSATAPLDYVDQTTARDAYLVEPIDGDPELEDDYTRRLDLRLRSVDGLPWEGF